MTDEPFQTHGLSKDFRLPCFIAGHVNMNGPMKHCLSGAVVNKEAGLRIVAMFNGKALMFDKPAGVQVVIAALPKHLAALKELDSLIRANGNVITDDIIAKVKAKPVRKPQDPSPG